MDKKEIKEILSVQLNKLRSFSYAELSARIDKIDAFEVIGKSGTRYQLEVQYFWDHKPNDSVRVVVNVDDGGIRAFVPVTDSFIISAEGRFIGEAGRGRSMTIRSKIEQVRRTLYALSFITLLSTVFTMTFSDPVIPIIALVAFFLSCVSFLLFLRCPRCKKNLVYAINFRFPSFSIFRISSKIKVCPFCGVDFDSEIPK